MELDESAIQMEGLEGQAPGYSRYWEEENKNRTNNIKIFF
jgi:hypothetical protein